MSTSAAVNNAVVETMEQKIARLEAENQALKNKRDAVTVNKLSLRVSEKGGVSVYGVGRYPVTLYKEQWTRLLAITSEIADFIKANDAKLTTKE